MSDNILSLTHVSKSFGSRVLLRDITLGVDAGDKIGLIGDNGTGKSTLLRIIAGDEAIDGGQRAVRNQLRIGYLEQNPILRAEATAAEILRESFEPLLTAMNAYEIAARDMDPRADALLDTIDRLGGWEWEHHLQRVADDLGIDDLNHVVGHMSGGFQKRVALARLVLAAPDLVLLDEPTNHLDATTVDWLEQWLTQSAATCILVTHDRYFLERVVQRMAEVRDGVLRLYRGAYADYLAARAHEEETQEQHRHRRLQVLKSELAWARCSPPARSTKAKARLDQVTALQDEQERLRIKQETAEITFHPAPRLGRTILELRDVCHGFGDTVLIDHLSVVLRPGERFGILGPNGSGKTTLLRLLTGDLTPNAGEVIRGTNTRIAYFDQHRTDLHGQKTLRENLVPEGGDHVFPGGIEQGKPVHVASWLTRFAFRTEAHNMVADKLSGGERNRLALAKFLLQPANVLLLDEPTNDLDILTLNILEEALLEFTGCIVVVSHDRYFLDKVATGIIAFESEATTGTCGHVTVMQGDYTTYCRLRVPELEAMQTARRAQQRATPQKQAIAQHAAAQKTAPEPKKRGLSYAEQKELDQLEPAIEKAEHEMAALEAQLADPDVWRNERREGLALQSNLDGARARVQQLMVRWEELIERGRR